MTVSRLDPVRRARRTMAAGGALWREGLVYEAHAHMATALREALAAWVPVVGESGGTAPAAMEERAVRELAIAGYRDVDRVRDALAATVSVTGSASSDSIAASALSDFEWIWGEAERLCRFGSRRLATPVERQRARMRLTVVGALGLIVFGVLFVRIWARPHVSASGVFSREFPASYAVDGIDSTEWTLPDRTSGWLLIAFRSPRRVHSVQIVNGHNKMWMDRGVERFRVTAYSREGRVASAEGSFTGLTAARSALTVNLEAEKVTEIRVDVLSYLGLGGALAEVEVR